MAEQVQETVGMATGDESGHGTASTKDKEETGENVQEGDTPAAPSNRGPAKGRISANHGFFLL
jgi:hypothetical protein